MKKRILKKLRRRSFILRFKDCKPGIGVARILKAKLHPAYYRNSYGISTITKDTFYEWADRVFKGRITN